MWRFYNYWSENLRNDVFSVLSEGVNDLLSHSDRFWCVFSVSAGLTGSAVAVQVVSDALLQPLI